MKIFTYVNFMIPPPPPTAVSRMATKVGAGWLDEGRGRPLTLQRRRRRMLQKNEAEEDEATPEYEFLSPRKSSCNINTDPFHVLQE